MQLWELPGRSEARSDVSSPVPVIPIIGARKLSQLQDNLASFDLILSADQLKTLDEASRIELGFPHDLYPKSRTFTYGGLRDQILA
jgi:diketogulonate reductase-like aldo/keto reductase